MENDNKKILTVSFVVCGFLAFFVTSLLLTTIATSFASLGPYLQSDLVRQGLPVLIGFGTFFVLQFNPKVINFCDEVVIELKKIVWPSRKDTVAMTIVVCVMVVISGVALGFLDFCASYIVNWLVTR